MIIMPNQSDGQNTFKFSTIQKVPSSESFLMKHGSIKSSHEEYTPKVLPPSMREAIHQNTVNVLRRIRSQLKEFTTFVEEIQNNTPSENQLFASSCSPEALKPTGSSITRNVQPADPRPKNAPLRDAFQMVRNLLSRISNVIDQVAADIDAEDDQRRDVHSPDFDYYYAQYVFQMTNCILQTVGEELEQFSKVLAEVSVDDILSKLPTKVDEVDVSLSSHKIFPEKIEFSDSFEASPWSSDTNTEESSSATDDSRSKLRKQGQEALQLMTFLSKKILHYLEEKGLPELDETQQREFSKRVLGIPDLCKHCSKKVAKKLRRYTSRENLFAEKYEKASDEALFSDNSAMDIQTARTSRTCLGSISTHISDTEIKMTYHQPLKSPSHFEPLIRGLTEAVSGTNQMNGLDDVIAGVITVTEDPGKAQKIDFIKQRGKINFNLQKFCALLKEQFRKFLSEERKDDTSQSKNTDSNVISNIIIQCAREATEDGDEQIKQSSVRFNVTAHSSRDADGENKVRDSKPNNKEEPSAEEHEKQLDDSLGFMREAYQLAVSALQKKNSRERSLK